MVQFAYTILYVKDVVKSVSFYEKAFGFERTLITPGDEYGELSTGSTTLAFAATTLAATNLPEGFIPGSTHGKPFGIEIGFTTTDVAQTLKDAIEAGAIAVTEAKLKPWGQTVAYVRDIDGFLIEICTPMG